MPKESEPSGDREKDERLIYLLHERLGEISVEQYTNLPRKPKKTAKKISSGKPPSQMELSRLERALRNSRD